MSSLDTMRSLAVLPSAMLAKIHSVWEKPPRFSSYMNGIYQQKNLHEANIQQQSVDEHVFVFTCSLTSTLWSASRIKVTACMICFPWELMIWSICCRSHHDILKLTENKKHARTLMVWNISHNAFISACVCVSLVVSTADFAENRESSSTRLCQGLTGGGITVPYPNTEQSPPSPSDQPEMPSSERKHFKSYRAGQ